MLVSFFSLLGIVLLMILIIRTWISQGNDRITELYTCHCGSGSHYWLSDKKLECNKCGLVKEVNPNGIIVRN